jgi:Protein of unknown function (DUF1559)
MKRKSIAVVGIVLSLAGLYLISNIYRIRNATEESKCQSNLSSIGSAMYEYHNKYGCFPPSQIELGDRKLVHSWRVLLLEFIDPKTFNEYHFDDAWDSPENRLIETKMPSCYSCPTDITGKQHYYTSYFVAVGPDTVFPELATIHLNDIVKPHSETVLVLESIGRRVHWMQPSDLDLNVMLDLKAKVIGQVLFSNHLRGPLVCMVDLSKCHIRDFEDETVEGLIKKSSIRLK